jgi:uncharacterized protein (DUF433 family)
MKVFPLEESYVPSVSLDYLEESDRLDDFLEDFPTASREHVIAVLELAKESLIRYASAA